eukprot:CAMPEP_0197864824 /NCGR_PEP_ID=MMETSP1438-20131217/43309_1 /TAXON_ID=1461541 /ORGANISM="Pterosperma sp., Strain CCMP1384" /LENGTH=676 /DNA_ID=CAMNT_0043483197 /DNA_START=342 /DNA_END=2372 /DNA_ORIENTATION=-
MPPLCTYTALLSLLLVATTEARDCGARGQAHAELCPLLQLSEEEQQANRGRKVNVKDLSEASPFEGLPKSLGSCSIVGLSESLLKCELGADIDNQDTVFRIGFAPLEKYAANAGTKVSYMLCRTSECHHGTKPSRFEDNHGFMYTREYTNGTVILRFGDARAPEEVTRDRHGKPPAVFWRQSMNAQDLLQTTKVWGRDKDKGPKFGGVHATPTSAFGILYDVLQGRHCSSYHVYGFGGGLQRYSEVQPPDKKIAKKKKAPPSKHVMTYGARMKRNHSPSVEILTMELLKSNGYNVNFHPCADQGHSQSNSIKDSFSQIKKAFDLGSKADKPRNKGKKDENRDEKLPTSTVEEVEKADKKARKTRKMAFDKSKKQSNRDEKLPTPTGEEVQQVSMPTYTPQMSQGLQGVAQFGTPMYTPQMPQAQGVQQPMYTSQMPQAQGVQQYGSAVQAPQMPLDQGSRQFQAVTSNIGLGDHNWKSSAPPQALVFSNFATGSQRQPQDAATGSQRQSQDEKQYVSFGGKKRSDMPVHREEVEGMTVAELERFIDVEAEKALFRGVHRTAIEAAAMKKKQTNKKQTNKEQTNKKQTNKKQTNKKQTNKKQTNKKQTNKKQTNKKQTNKKQTNKKQTNKKQTNKKQTNKKQTNKKQTNKEQTNKEQTKGTDKKKQTNKEQTKKKHG